MKRCLSALMIAAVALLVIPALAEDLPVITSPQQGAPLGPNYDVIGHMPYRAFLVVHTDVIRCDTNEVIATVPGIRHWTRDDGTFHFRVASPRVSIGDETLSLRYEVKVFEASPAQSGPVTLVSATCISPGPARHGNIAQASLTEPGNTMPVITYPQEMSTVGPNYDVIGRMPYRAFMVVMTDVIDTETGEVIHTVPGIRNWTNQDGSFHFRVASPRVSMGQKDRVLSYRIRVYEAGTDGNGPEAVINAQMAR